MDDVSMISGSNGQVVKRTTSRKCALISLKRSVGPAGAAGNDWYRYVINTPGAPITGYRRGKKREVMAYLNECTSQLDERLRSGKAPRAAAGRKPKQAPASN